MMEVSPRILPPHDREGLTPIPLPAHEPIPQLVVDGLLPEPLRLEPMRNLLFRLHCRQAVQGEIRIGRMNSRALVGKTSPLLSSRWFHHLDHRELKFLREFE